MRRLAAALVAIVLVLPAAAMAAPSIAGNFQGWNPADPASELTENANGVYELTISAVGDSTHEYKAIDGDTWSDAFPGANQTFTPSTTQDVTFYVNLGATVASKEGDEYVFHSLNPPIVCGDFMSELGGSDWDQTDTSTTVMSDGDGDDVWEFSSVIPAGSYNFKIVLNNNWDQTTSPANIPFGSDGINSVLFTYDMSNNTTQVFTAAPPTVLSARIPAACPQDLTKIEVRFSKDVEETTAETVTNYAVATGHTVVAATRDDSDNDIVVLEVTPAVTAGEDIQVTVTGVTDLDGRPVDPSNNTACFYVHEVVFEVNMSLYGVPTTLHIQGATYPLTWDQCAGCEAKDDGLGDDAAAGDTTYTVTEYFSMGYTCGASAESTEVKYKYVVDCTTWEEPYDFGHFVTLDPNAASQTMSVWWEDNAPVDYIGCDVGVKFQVSMKAAILQGDFDPTAGDTLTVNGSLLPLEWVFPPVAVEAYLVDDGTNGDVTPADSLYTATITFPSGTYRYLAYKYAIDGVYECDTYPDRALELDDVNGCVTLRDGPMIVLDLWDWCDVIADVPVEHEVERSWGAIKSLFGTKKK